MIERRLAKRWQIDLGAKAKFGKAECLTVCNIRDISFKGMQVLIGYRLPKDTFIKVSVVLSGEFILETEAWVVWHRAIDGFNIYGLYFNKVKEENRVRIYQFIQRNFPESIVRQSGEKLTQEKGGTKMEDRRVFARFPISYPARVLHLDANREIEAQVHDISAKGVGLLMKERLFPFAPLEIWIEIPNRNEPFYIRGEVAWSKSVEAGQNSVGVNLEKADLVKLSSVLNH